MKLKYSLNIIGLFIFFSVLTLAHDNKLYQPGLWGLSADLQKSATNQYYMSETELMGYLQRSISMQPLSRYNKPNNSYYYHPCCFQYDATRYSRYQDTLRMIGNIRPKFIGRAAGIWGQEWENEYGFRRAAKATADVHAIDSDIIMQAAIFEFVNENLGDGPGEIRIEIPGWVYTAFRETVPANATYFDFDDIVYNDWSTNPDHKFDAGAVPDMAKPEARKWFYYRAVRYIDSGFEALHLGQVKKMNDNDPGNQHWWNLVTMIRSYAAANARRNFVLLDAHTEGEYLGKSNRLLFDFHSDAIRMEETVANSNGTLECRINESSGMYGKSKGGLTYMGWSTSSLPFIVEFDNYDISNYAGQRTAAGHPAFWFNWGYDEITWFALQPESYRKHWLDYAWHKVRCLDRKGFLQMPGIRGMRYHTQDPWPYPVYFANTPSAVLPDPDTDGDGFPDLTYNSSDNGYNLENTIKGIWNGQIKNWYAFALNWSAPDNATTEFEISKDGYHVFYKGADQKLYEHYWTGTTWAHQKISTNSSVNVAGHIRTDKYGKVYYKGTDNRVHAFYKSSSTATQWSGGGPLTSSAPQNIDDDYVLNENADHIFYRGTDGRIYNYWWDGNQWHFDALNWQAPANAVGKVQLDKHGKVYYLGDTNRIHVFYWTGSKWEGGHPLTLSGPANATNDFIIDQAALHVFYRGSNNKMYNYWWNGSQWGNAILNNSAPDNVSGSLRVDHHGKVYYRGTDGLVYNFYWTGAWNHAALKGGVTEDVSGDFTINSSARNIFYKATNGHMYNYWWNGSSWQHNKLTHCPVALGGSSPEWDDVHKKLYYVDQGKRVFNFIHYSGL